MIHSFLKDTFVPFLLPFFAFCFIAACTIVGEERKQDLSRFSLAIGKDS